MKPKIFILSGSQEYRSAETLALWRRRLEAAGHSCTQVDVADQAPELPGWEQLAEYDVLVVFCRRLELQGATLAAVQSWCRAGRPLIGIRTASHAFQTWLEFDREVLGGDYSGHGAEETVEVSLHAGGHPVTAGMAGWRRPDKLYRNPRIDPSCIVLLHATGQDGRQPVAWCRHRVETGGRVFYTSLGTPSDFAHDAFLGMLDRAVEWVAAKGFAGGYHVAHLADIDAVPCPCGMSRRAFLSPENKLATLHMVDITEDARTHYHKKLTEIYLVLEGSGHMELNGERVPVGPLTTIFIEPGCRHRAVGKMRIVNIPIPAFDPHDEWFD